MRDNDFVQISKKKENCLKYKHGHDFVLSNKLYSPTSVVIPQPKLLNDKNVSQACLSNVLNDRYRLMFEEIITIVDISYHARFISNLGPYFSDYRTATKTDFSFSIRFSLQNRD